MFDMNSLHFISFVFVIICANNFAFATLFKPSSSLSFLTTIEAPQVQLKFRELDPEFSDKVLPATCLEEPVETPCKNGLYTQVKRSCSANTVDGDVATEFTYLKYTRCPLECLDREDHWAVGAVVNRPVTRKFANNTILCSPNLQYRLKFQSSGNLELTSNVENQAPVLLWSSNTTGRASTLNFQADGNFILYGNGDVPVFVSETSNRNATKAQVTNAGRFEIVNEMGTLWSTA